MDSRSVETGHREKGVRVYCTAEESGAASSPCGSITLADVSLPRREAETHKGDYGRLLLVGGSIGYTGAPNLMARAAVRGGAGLVYLGVPENIWSICAVKNDEAMPFPLPTEADGRLGRSALPILRERWGSTAVLAVGPGLGRSEGVQALVGAIVSEYPGALILDADALWAIAEQKELLHSREKGTTILTPHTGEFERLGGFFSGERIADAKCFAAQFGCILVLKGHRTVVAYPDGKTHLVAHGNPGMACGGSGDVLTGILAAMVGQFGASEGVKLGTVLHAAAGDASAEEKGEYGMLPTDIIEKLPYVMKGITK